MVVGLLISAFLLLVGGSAIVWVASAIFAAALNALTHIILFALGVIIVWKFLIPRFDQAIKTKTRRDDKNLLIGGSIAVGLFLLGIPGLVFSVADAPAPVAHETQGIILGIGSSVLPDFPVLGFGLIGLIVLIALGVATGRVKIKL